eukprot:TRINITY_DN201_c0_g1_i3.p1 TRINITY_DN201_c0_g1~~TRINITY_DN201_c0_g1_i3.p1  ORF type:complete len:226 (+),score=31.22 TRINITY_DN201_c0_g1_i3:75-752(+)
MDLSPSSEDDDDIEVIPTWQLTVLILSVTAGSFFIGLERIWHNKPIGFGTFILVAVGAACMSAIANQVNTPTILSGVISGIGFLGAGSIFKEEGGYAAGLTTASLIWSLAIFGITMGFGEYQLAVIIYTVIVLVLIGQRIFKCFGVGSRSHTLKLKFKYEPDWKKRINKFFPFFGFQLISYELENDGNHNIFITVRYLVRVPTFKLLSILKKLQEDDMFLGIKYC